MSNQYEINLFSGDCLEIMPQLKEKSFDLILSDPPYGITQCDWDSVIPFPEMWENIKRVLKPGGTVALFGSQPFTSKLVMSNLKWFKYEWIWEKSTYSNFANVKLQPARLHENICIFYKKAPTYNCQMQPGVPYKNRGGGNRKAEIIKNQIQKRTPIENTGERYPSSIQFFNNGNHGSQHPTRKPTALLEYLIRTYTDQGDHVLDFCMGSGSTGVACQNTGRHFTGIEIEEKYYKIAQQRMKENRRLLVF